MAKCGWVEGVIFYQYSVIAPTKKGETKTFEGVWAPTPHDAVKRIIYPVELHDYEHTMPPELRSCWNLRHQPRHGFATEWGLKHSKLDLLMPSPSACWVVVDSDGNETICRRRVRRPEKAWRAVQSWLWREIIAGVNRDRRKHRKSLVRGR